MFNFLQWYRFFYKNTLKIYMYVSVTQSKLLIVSLITLMKIDSLYFWSVCFLCVFYSVMIPGVRTSYISATSWSLLWSKFRSLSCCTTSLYRGPLSLPLDMLEIYHGNIFRCGSFFFSYKIYGLEHKSFNKVVSKRFFLTE